MNAEALSHFTETTFTGLAKADEDKSNTAVLRRAAKELVEGRGEYWGRERDERGAEGGQSGQWECDESGWSGVGREQVIGSGSGAIGSVTRAGGREWDESR